MSWDFSTDPEWAQQLEWVENFVRTECEPIDMIVNESHDLNDPVRQALIPPLQEIVKQRGLWATHLGPHLGGPGYGQVKLALLNEILGRSECAPIVFGSQAPDSGNSEILAHYGTPELKQRYLEPLLDNRIVSCFSMTEPQGGADPKVFRTTAVAGGDHWIINGEKWFSSFASMASFIIVMAMTDPDALRKCAGPGRSHARPARRGLRRRADPPGRRAHSPRDAHGWVGAPHLRHDL
jgi:alkylation response protein AidB-like acyl-CoA dehydrogenase